MDTTALPGDDFFRYANGLWASQAVIPPDHAEVGTMQAAIDGMDVRMRGLLEAASAESSGTAAGKLGGYYRRFQDAGGRARHGVAPVAPLLGLIAHAADRRRLAGLMGRQQADFTGSLLDMSVDVDQNDGHRYVVVLGQSGLLMPGRDDYLDPAFASQRGACLVYMRGLLAAADFPDPKKAADDVMAFETRLAQASWSDAQQEPAAARRMTQGALARVAPGIDWPRFFASAEIPPDQTVMVDEPGAAHALARVYDHTPLPVLRAWMTVHTMDRAALFLTPSLVTSWQVFHGQALAGASAPLPSWQLAVHTVAGMQCVGSGGPSPDCFGSLRWAAGDLYLAAYLPADMRDNARTMIDALRAAFRHRLAHEPWMKAATRVAALRKLDAYTVNLGGPAQPDTLDDLTLDTGNLPDLARAIAARDWSRQRARLSQPVDPHAWVEAPQTVDANNGPALNIEFPAGLLQMPVFDVHRDAAYNFGAMGAFIGHELTHGFDETGRHIDADNRRHDWWTTADDKAFRRNAAALARQYDVFEPLPGRHVHGVQTLDENIADLGGLSVALDAYHASLHGEPAPVVDGLSGDQRVFLGWAWLWRGRKTDAALRQQLADDVHAPYPARVNGPVRNIDAWYSAFGVTARQTLYVAPKGRVSLW